jgi:hypothetical protein
MMIRRMGHVGIVADDIAAAGAGSSPHVARASTGSDDARR